MSDPDLGVKLVVRIDFQSSLDRAVFCPVSRSFRAFDSSSSAEADGDKEHLAL
jgi:hypothetical protein